VAGIPWRRYISALRRYKWLMLLVIIVGTGATVLATRFMKPAVHGAGDDLDRESVRSRRSGTRRLRSRGVQLGRAPHHVHRARLGGCARAAVPTFTDPKDSVLFTTSGCGSDSAGRVRPADRPRRAAASAYARPKDSPCSREMSENAVGTRIGFDWTPPTDRLARTKAEGDVQSHHPRDASAGAEGAAERF